MKKTCFNCSHFHGCLAEEYSSQYHIHNYCDKFNMCLEKDTETEVNAFLVDHWQTMCKACPENLGVSDDFETGEAACWMFDEADKPFWPDDRYEKNRAKNKDLAIKTLEYMFEKQEVYDELERTWTVLTEYYSEKELDYLRDLLKRLKNE